MSQTKAHEGCKIKKGTHGEVAVYYQPAYNVAKDSPEYNEEEAKNSFAFAKYYPVFDVANVEGIDSKLNRQKVSEVFAIDKCESIVNAFTKKAGVKIVHVAENPCYYPVNKEVHIAEIKNYKAAEGYYYDMFQYLVMAAGFEQEVFKHINRGEIPVPDIEMQRRIELMILDIAMGQLVVKTGIPEDIEAAAIQSLKDKLESWKVNVEKSATCFINCIRKAEKIVNYILDPNAVAEKTETKKADKKEAVKKTETKKAENKAPAAKKPAAKTAKTNTVKAKTSKKTTVAAGKTNDDWMKYAG
jgi:antirestriction protein ArdC